MRPLKSLAPFLAPYPGVIAAALAALIASAAATLVVPYAVRQMIDHGFSADDARFINQYFIVLFAIAAVLGISTAIRFYFVTWLGERVVADLRRAVYSHVLSLSPAFFEITRTGEVLSRLTTDTTLIQTVVGSSTSIALRNAVLLVGGVIMLVITSPTMAAMMLIGVPAVVFPIIAFGRRVRRLSRASQDRIADTSAYAGETINAVQTVQAFTHEAHDRAAYASAVEDAFAAAIGRARARALMTAIVIFLAFAGIVGVLWGGAHQVLDGDITGGELGQFIFYAVLVAGGVGNLSEVWGDLQAAAGATERLMEILRIRPAIAAPAVARPLPEPSQGAIAFEKVTFRYPARPDVSALNEVSFSVRPGETVALVGPSGAGKTTCFQLFLRFYDPQAGTITFDGVPITAVSPQTLRRQIALVPQETMIFAGTVHDNIRFGRPEASDKDVEAAAEAAQAARFIADLPDGYRTVVGERGVTLSGGQRQRIAIARALAVKPKLLICDEPTSALDVSVQAQILNLLADLQRDEGLAMLFITHNLAAVGYLAHRVAVMKAGRIVETGTTREILTRPQHPYTQGLLASVV